MLTKQEQHQMNAYLSDYIRKKDKGTTVQKVRHKIGSILWPLANKAVILGMAGSAGLILGSALTQSALIASLPAVATFIGVGTLGAYVTGGYMTFIENITLRKAALLGKHMMRDHIPEKHRLYAIKKYMQKEGALFLNAKYVRKNPDKIAFLCNGQNVPPIPNFISFIEDNSNRAMSGGRQITPQIRAKFWAKSVRDILQASSQDNPVSLFKSSPKKQNLQSSQSHLSALQTLRSSPSAEKSIRYIRGNGR